MVLIIPKTLNSTVDSHPLMVVCGIPVEASAPVMFLFQGTMTYCYSTLLHICKS